MFRQSDLVMEVTAMKKSKGNCFVIFVTVVTRRAKAFKPVKTNSTLIAKRQGLMCL